MKKKEIVRHCHRSEQAGNNSEMQHGIFDWLLDLNKYIDSNSVLNGAIEFKSIVNEG